MIIRMCCNLKKIYKHKLNCYFKIIKIVTIKNIAIKSSVSAVAMSLSLNLKS